MAHEFYTVILVPNAKARFRKFHVSVQLTKWTLGLFIPLMIGLPIHYTFVTVELNKMKRQRAQDEALLGQVREYETSTKTLQEKLKVLQSMVTKLGVMAGLEQSLPSETVAGVGGVSRGEATPPNVTVGSLQAMEKNVSHLTNRSALLESYYREKNVLLSSTPSIWPVHGYLSAHFGNRQDPFTGQPDFHPGIDISSPEGTSITAPAAGLVLSAERKGGYGNCIILDHGFGLVTRYAHLSAFNVRAGQKVKRGDLIGHVGSTGKSTGPHLHYEVWMRDQVQNPLHFILDEFRTFG